MRGDEKQSGHVALSKSMACSALCAKCVRPYFIFVILASGSGGCVQSSFEPFFSASDRPGPNRRASASRSRRPWRAWSETRHIFHAGLGARCSARPRSLQASWRRYRSFSL